jgi:hypothetical protein
MLYRRTKSNIKYITQDDANIILNLWEEEKAFLCEGLFIVRSGDTFTAIDNSTGECWTEDFKSNEDAVAWLLIA